jgi:GDP-L-fucose synthase
MDVSRLRSMGWQAKIGLQEGIEETYAWYLDTSEPIRA